MAKITVTLLTLALVLVTSVYGEEGFYFIFGTPGSRRGLAGLYGGKFKPNELPENLDLETTKLNRASFDNSYLTGFGVDQMSYDPVSKNILLLFSNNLQYYLSLTDPCDNKKIISEDMYFGGIGRLRTGPFALHDSKVYFVARDNRIEGQKVISILTIQKVTDCLDEVDTFMNRDGYHKERCTTEIAKLVEKEIFSYPDSSGSLTPNEARDINDQIKSVGTTLHAVKDGDKLHFLVLIANPLYETSSVRTVTYTLDLYQVQEGAEATMLHSQTVQTKWTGYIIQSIGDISYKDGLLCWSAFEHLLCSEWRPSQSIGEVHEVIKPGDAAGICNTSDHYQDYKNILTGVAIANADPVELTFGCWSGVSSNGGAGYLSARRDWSNKQIKLIADKKGKIFAGNMLIIEACPENTKEKKEKETTEETEETEIKTADDSSNALAKKVSLVLVISSLVTDILLMTSVM